DRLRELLRERHLLLVLDNFEHLPPAAPLLPELLANSAGLKILVTSRARLRLSGEHEVAVAPLALPNLAALPPLADLPAYGAIRLWCDRARAANPAFAL